MQVFHVFTGTHHGRLAHMNSHCLNNLIVSRINAPKARFIAVYNNLAPHIKCNYAVGQRTSTKVHVTSRITANFNCC